MQQLEMISQTIKHFYWTLILQGAIFIALAVLIVVYPAILVALVAAAFLVIGLALLVLAAKVYQFWQKLPSFLKK